MAHPFSVIAKPIGPRCNIDCRYCYYLEKERLYPDTGRFRMADAVLSRFVADHLAAQEAAGLAEVVFLWQGGEPTILGIDFFRRVLELQAAAKAPGTVVRNALQTNGTLIDAEWAAFLAASGFLVGLSLDGPRAIHDRYRRDRAGRPTFEAARRGLDLLLAAGVETNILTAVHRGNVLRPREVYEFLTGLGCAFLQFIPIVERRGRDGGLCELPPPAGPADAEVTEWSVAPLAWGRFLCEIFDLWHRRDTGRISVQFFDVQLGLWAGGPAGLCVFAEDCGGCLALEHNGDLYACDHYVYPAFRLGNIMSEPLAAMAASPVQAAFGTAKSATLPAQCRGCRFRFACNGGCPKHRFARTADGEAGLNYLCEGFRKFFRHAGPRLSLMAGRLAAGLPPRPAAAGR
ncbi:MAG: anaerobic sulfatase maturase [Rhodobacteraceae bacterium]|nr:anaerobic sulfatase maturase [Paracoccaceae bacterium]